MVRSICSAIFYDYHKFSAFFPIYYPAFACRQNKKKKNDNFHDYLFSLIIQLEERMQWYHISKENLFVFAWSECCFMFQFGTVDFMGVCEMMDEFLKIYWEWDEQSLVVFWVKF